MKITIKTDSIKIGQLLKKIGIISSGGQAKSYLLDNEVKINGQLVRSRGIQVKNGATLWINDDLYQVIKEG
ncbi:MAG: RNA-binding S4 domain-containing protein [Mycoplasmatales bacterium]|nr:RNA-binding S4 domain-containing protein [Mycoplasmatales bacterium]